MHRDDYIRGLSAAFGTYFNYDQPTSVVKYEKRVDTDPDTQIPVPHSKFTLLVTSPDRTHISLTTS